MFPSDVNLNSILPDAQATTTTDIGRSMKFDYANKKFVFVDGANVEPGKIEAIEQWIHLFILTRIKAYRVYTDDFGVDTDNLLGWRLPRSIAVSEIKRMITEGIYKYCPAVVQVYNWTFDKGTFAFNVKTDTGEEVTISDDY